MIHTNNRRKHQHIVLYDTFIIGELTIKGRYVINDQETVNLSFECFTISIKIGRAKRITSNRLFSDSSLRFPIAVCGIHQFGDERDTSLLLWCHYFEWFNLINIFLLLVDNSTRLTAYTPIKIPVWAANTATG